MTIKGVPEGVRARGGWQREAASKAKKAIEKAAKAAARQLPR